MTIQDAGLYLGQDYASAPGSTGGDGIGPKYTNWDHSSIGVCNCDPGFFGPDCSRRMCPKNDDPVTINQNKRQLMIRLKGNGHSFSGKLKVAFLGYVGRASEASEAIRTPAGATPHHIRIVTLCDRHALHRVPLSFLKLTLFINKQVRRRV